MAVFGLELFRMTCQDTTLNGIWEQLGVKIEK